MPPKTLADGVESDSEVGPVALDGIERHGATRFGRRVVRVVLEMEGGGKVSIHLPTTAAAKDWTKTKPGRAILDILGNEGRPMKGQTIARIAGLEYAGSFRQALKGLTDQGEIEHHDGEYSLPD